MNTAASASSRIGDTIFVQPWWLDAVAPGQWAQVTAGDSKSGARLTFQLRSSLGFTMLGNPELSPHCGPSFVLASEKHETRVSEVRHLTEELIAAMPRASLVRLCMTPGYFDFLPFRWAGFDVSLACTHQFADLSDIDTVWRGCSEACRRAVRKASKQLQVVDEPDIDSLLAIARMSFARQNSGLPYSQGAVRRLYESARARDSVWALAARDAEGRTHGVALFVMDAHSVYYLLGGADPALRSSGAQSLLLWEGIRRASQAGRAFDFEGSSNPEIERFFRGFGPVRQPLLLVSRAGKVASALSAARQRVQRFVR